jgi:hypothetical protein
MVLNRRLSEATARDVLSSVRLEILSPGNTPLS